MAYANPNKLSGLSPVKSLNGSNWNGKGNLYCVLSTEATYNYFVGDLVALQGGGDSNGIPSVALAQPGAAAVGVIQAIGLGSPNSLSPLGGPLINPNNLAQTYAPVVKAYNYYCLVIDDPDVIFEIQETGSGTNLTSTNAVGLNANILLGGQATAAAGSVTTYVSSTGLTNAATPTTTSTLNLKIVSFAQRPDNKFVTSPATNGYQKWWCLINNHQYRGGITAP